jgi:hypothetical protein
MTASLRANRIKIKPAVLWNLQRDENETASAVVFPLRRDATLYWWVNSELQGARYFPTIAQAIEAAEHVRQALAADGWARRGAQSACLVTA